MGHNYQWLNVRKTLSLFFRNHKHIIKVTFWWVAKGCHYFVSCHFIRCYYSENLKVCLFILSTNFSPQLVLVSSKIKGSGQEHTTSSPTAVGLAQSADESQPPLLTVHFWTKRKLKALLLSNIRLYLIGKKTRNETRIKIWYWVRALHNLSKTYCHFDIDSRKLLSLFFSKS